MTIFQYYYTAHVDSEDMSVLPVLHIPTHGEVPHQAQGKRIEGVASGGGSENSEFSRN